MFLLINPRVLLALAVMLSMWEFQDRPLDMSTPKYLELVTTSRTWPCNSHVNGKCTDFLEVVTLTTWHFKGLNSMSHLYFHTISLSKSWCNTFLSSVLPTVRYTAVSSVIKCTFEVSSSGRSLMYMYMRKWMGPKTEPCEKLDVTGTNSDSSPPRTTVCDWLPRKARIQRYEFPLIPHWWSFQRSLLEWFNLSKAFEKSSSTRSVCFPALAFLARSSTNVASWVPHDHPGKPDIGISEVARFRR